jgi:hypothetical protein
MRRELHERFMPDGVWTRNNKIARSITFIYPQSYPQLGALRRPLNLRRALFSGADRCGNSRAACWIVDNNIV